MDFNTFDSLVYTKDTKGLEDARIDGRKAAVGDVVFCDGAYSLVLHIREHVPGSPGHAAQKRVHSEYVAVEVVTTNGSRWYGKPLNPRESNDGA